MPEYLAPGVYVEETSFRAKSIEGTSTTTTGFVGPTRYGPVDLEPEIITSLIEFERMYGDRLQLRFNGEKPMHNFLWHAARAFFEEGGKRLYIARVFKQISDSNSGKANKTIGSGGGDAAITIEARFPGKLGNMRICLTLRLGQNLLSLENPKKNDSKRIFPRLLPCDVVWISDISSPITSSPTTGTFYIAQTDIDPVTKEATWSFANEYDSIVPDELTQRLNPLKGDQVRVVTLTVTAMLADSNRFPVTWEGLPLDPRHNLSNVPDSFDKKFDEFPSNFSQARTLPIVVRLGDQLTDGLKVLNALLEERPSIETELINEKSTDAERSIFIDLDGGNDGVRPEASDYEGESLPNKKRKTGMKLLEDLEDISIIAAPGATFGYEEAGYNAAASTIVNMLISHAQRMRYRIAVLDSGDGQSISQVRAMRAKLDSSHAALYYPWVRVLDPVTRQEISLPPSGFVAGIYARNDINRAVYKAPANEVVNLALGFEQMLNKTQQEVLNPEGINCFRFFEGRGYRLWGARTISSDPEWKYVNVRRYFIYLERSIDRGTQWAVFEPNGELLWSNIRHTIEDFLLNEWQNGALLGDKPEKAFFVKCDRSTMTQNGLDNGRLVCLIGVALLKPAEFVIFRIGQWTADRKI